MALQLMSDLDSPNKPKKRLTLWVKTLLLAILCWVIPLLLIVLSLGSYIDYRLSEQMSGLMSTSVENAVSLTQERLNRAVSSCLFPSYDTTIPQAYDSYRRTGDDISMSNRISTFLAIQYRYDSSFLAVMLHMDGVEQTLHTYDQKHSALQAVWDYEECCRTGVTEYAKTLGTYMGFYRCEADNRLYMVRNLVNEHFETYGVLVMELNQERIFEPLTKVGWDPGVTVWLGGDMIPVLRRPDNISDTIMQNEAYSHEILGGADGFVDNGDVIGIYGTVENTHYKMPYLVVAESHIIHQESNVLWAVALCIIFCLFIQCAITLFFFRRNVTEPTDELSLVAKEVQQGRYGIRIDPESYTTQEFYTLGQNVNNMSIQLQYQFERIYKEELALRDAQIKALQSQINPHFLGNTLEIINWEARMAGNTQVSAMLEALSTMLEAVNDRRHRPVIHLSEELMYSNAYLTIIQQRMGKRLTVKKEIDDNLLSEYVPRLILQPVIENAVEHGISVVQQGTVVIRAYREEDVWMILEVENDGALSEEDAQRIKMLLDTGEDSEGQRARNIGIRNVHLRLQILYGSESGLSIFDSGHGTTISKIRLSLIDDGKSNQNMPNEFM